MKETTSRLLEQIDAAHDWAQGQVWGSGGTRLSSTDICQVCSMRRHWLTDPQNGVDSQYRFSSGETGEDLSLRQAIAQRCAGE